MVVVEVEECGVVELEGHCFEVDGYFVVVVVLIDGRVQQRQICVFKAQFVQRPSSGRLLGLKTF